MTDVENQMPAEGASPHAEDSGGPPRRRRWRRWVLLGLGLLSAVAVGAGLRWRAGYAPIAFDSAANVELGDELISGVEYPGGVLHGQGAGPGFHSAGFEDRETRTVGVSYRDGEHVTYALSLHNTGSVGVTVVGIDDSGSHKLLKPFEVRLGKKLPDGRSSIVETEPMRSFTLAGGESRSLVLRLRFTDCEWYEPGSGSGFGGVLVRYRVLGLNRVASLRVPVEISVESPPTCPRTGEARSSDPSPPVPATASPASAQPSCRASITSSPATFDAEEGTYATYITMFDEATSTVSFNVVQWLSGDDAVEAYRRDNPDDPDGPPNDYEIVNENYRVRSARVNADADVWLVRLRATGDASLKPGSLGEVSRYIADGYPEDVYWLTMSGGSVIEICEQYRP